MARDIFRCVWCHERYASLADLTQHLKEANHSAETQMQTQGRHFLLQLEYCIELARSHSIGLREPAPQKIILV